MVQRNQTSLLLAILAFGPLTACRPDQSRPSAARAQATGAWRVVPPRGWVAETTPGLLGDWRPAPHDALAGLARLTLSAVVLPAGEQENWPAAALATLGASRLDGQWTVTASRRRRAADGQPMVVIEGLLGGGADARQVRQYHWARGGRQYTLHGEAQPAVFATAGPLFEAAAGSARLVEGKP